MPYWDYSGNGIYFITMVTQNRECNLGKIVDGEIILSEYGEIVYAPWLKSFEIRAELLLDKWVIMPNHLHAIIVLKQNEYRCHPGSNFHQPFIRKPKSVSSFIAGFKSATNSKIDDYIDEKQLNIPKYNRNNHFWQPNYHDHIIRDDMELERIRNYIVRNPQNW
jgi:REP element-mobilizing transposase RayT